MHVIIDRILLLKCKNYISLKISLIKIWLILTKTAKKLAPEKYPSLRCSIILFEHVKVSNEHADGTDTSPVQILLNFGKWVCSHFTKRKKISFQVGMGL